MRKRVKIAQPSYESWKYEVDRQCKIRLKCSFDHLSNTEAPLREAYNQKIKPHEFIVQWIKKYNLTDLSNKGTWQL